MSHVEVARHQHGLDRLGQVQQPQQVAGRAARATHGLSRLLVREAELADQALQALRLLERIEVLALDVLDQRHRGGGLVGRRAPAPARSPESGQARGAEAPLARDDLVDRACSTWVGARPCCACQAARRRSPSSCAILRTRMGCMMPGPGCSRPARRARPRPCGCAAGSCPAPGRTGAARWAGRRRQGQAGAVVELGTEQRFEAAAQSLSFWLP